MRTTQRLDLTGNQFGRWKVVNFSHKNKRGEVYWNCVCDCGEKRPVKANSLTSGRSTSCGCYHLDAVITHGMYGTKTWKSWDAMKQRCTNSKSPDFYKYGGRGIKVCDRWLNSFENFYSDMGERPEGFTLDRIDNEKDYYPENCKWSTIDEQLYNRRNTIKIKHKDVMLTIKDLSEMSGLSTKIVRDRYNNGWTADQIISVPYRNRRN